jgi:hypothetical protein
MSNRRNPLKQNLVADHARADDPQLTRGEHIIHRAQVHRAILCSFYSFVIQLTLCAWFPVSDLSSTSMQ